MDVPLGSGVTARSGVPTPAHATIDLTTAESSQTTRKEMQHKFSYKDFDYLSGTVTSLQESSMLQTDAVHFCLNHGDMVDKLAADHPMTPSAESQLRNAGFTDFIVMPLITDFHISLAILHRKVPSDHLHIMDSLAADKDRDTLHQTIAENFIEFNKRTDGSTVMVQHLKTAQQVESFNCGMYAIRFFSVYLLECQIEGNFSALETIFPFEIKRLRKKLFDLMLTFIPAIAQTDPQERRQ